MKTIEHEGIVSQSDNNQTKVKIINLSACAGCHAKSACTMSDMEEKEIDVTTTENFKPGDKVVLIGNSSQGLKATWWAYVLPVVIVLTTLIIVFNLTGNENLAGIVALIILVPYFLLLKLRNSILKKTLSFTIQSKIE